MEFLKSTFQMYSTKKINGVSNYLFYFIIIL